MAVEYRINFSKRAVVYPTTKIGLSGRDIHNPVWKQRGRWDTSCEMTLVPKSIADGIGAEQARRPPGYEKTYVTIEKQKRKLSFAKLWYHLADVQGRIIRWQGVVAVFEQFPGDSSELRDTVYLGLHQCIEWVDPRIRMHAQPLHPTDPEGCIDIDIDVGDAGGRFPGTVWPDLSP